MLSPDAQTLVLSVHGEQNSREFHPADRIYSRVLVDVFDLEFHSVLFGMLATDERKEMKFSPSNFLPTAQLSFHSRVRAVALALGLSSSVHSVWLPKCWAWFHIPHV